MMVDQTQLEDAERLIQKMTNNWPAIQTQVTQFRSKAGVFALNVSVDTNPCIFWQRLANVQQTSELANIALTLLGFPQSCATVERSFSAVRRIHAWQRNKLGRNTLAKLVFLYVNRRVLQKRDLLND